MKHLLSTLMLLLTATVMMSAKVQPAPIFADNMVLQQKSDVALWGKAEPNAKVVIKTTWSKAKTVVTADTEGAWKARVATPEAGGPYEITISDGEKLTLKNVMIGEVWICSGQSNMEMQVRGFWGQPVEHSAEYILGADPQIPIRSCNIERVISLTPQPECGAVWYEHTPEGVAEASATAYFFARKLYDVLKIPVGVINVSWGGTPIEGWMDAEYLRKDFAGEINLSHIDSGVMPKDYAYQHPAVLYNGMLHSLIPYTAKGFIWYQGCNNRLLYDQYKRLQPAFVKMLREKWGNDRMPFYFTQIAPFIYEDPNRPEGGYMMWAQAQTLELIPYSGMAATHDIGDLYCIHPAKKKEVGDRLAMQALVNDYGLKGVDVAPPYPHVFEFKEGSVIVGFDAGLMGLSPINMPLEGFELAGEDKVFYPATAWVIDNMQKISVSSPDVPKPIAVRYGMKNYSVPSLFNCFGIPATPFRSDDWK
ncbi:MAG: sialate O-acetylesterase [Bacteroidales bacterium]|nr:sialate O-acetylesterase [Bacteroidales bacterium]